MIVYLATPYSHTSAATREERFQISCRVAAWAMEQGHSVFCPIAHSHPIAKYLPEDLLLSHEFWMVQDIPILAKCDELWVYPDDAADVSRGVAREIAEANRLWMPVRYVTPDEVYTPSAPIPDVPTTSGYSRTDWTTFVPADGVRFVPREIYEAQSERIKELEAHIRKISELALAKECSAALDRLEV